MPRYPAQSSPRGAPHAVGRRAPAASLDAGAHGLRRTLGAVLLVAAFVAAWAWLAQQHATLWERLPASAVERLVPDQLRTPLPAPVPWRALQALCERPLPAWQRWWPGQERRQLAACLADPAQRVAGNAQAAASERFELALRAQVQAAERWLQTWAADSVSHRADLEDALQRVQLRPAGELQPLVAVFGRLAAGQEAASTVDAAPAATSTSPRNPVERQIHHALLRAQTRMDAAAATAPDERAVHLGLAAAGLQLSLDYGHAPPRAVLLHDRASLAATLERQRRAQALAARSGGPQTLAALQAVPAGLMQAGAVLLWVALLLAAAGRAPWAAVPMWGAVSLMLGLGALLLTDLAFTADPALRHLAGRQFVVFGLGAWAVPLLWRPLPGLVFFWPLLLVALALAATAAVRHGQGRVLAPVRAWVEAGASPLWALAPSVALLLTAAAWLVVPGMSAAASEALLAIAALGLATYAARQSALAASGGGLQAYNLGIVLVACAAAVGGALLRADLGHALAGLALLLLFAALFAGGALRWGLLSLALGAMALVMHSWWSGAWQGPFAWLSEELLPLHAQQRMQATFDPFGAEASDLARMRWLMASAGMQGWGPGQVPWQGLDPAHAADSLPLQGPSDYVPALLAALWGSAWGLVLACMLVLLFGAAAVLGLRTAAAPGTPLAVRALAAFGGFGCAGVAVRALLSLGGVLGTLPLTGVPVALLGYGPVAHAAALVYLVLALAWRARWVAVAARGVQVAPRPVALQGPAARALGWGLGAAALAVAMSGAGLVLLLRQGAPGEHVAQQRLQWAEAVAQALRPAPVGATEAAQAVDAPRADDSTLANCPAGLQAVAAWNKRLAAHAAHAAHAAKATETAARSVVPGMTELLPAALDAGALLAARPLNAAGGCGRWARRLGQLLQADFHRIVGAAPQAVMPAAAASVPTPLHARLAALEPPRPASPRRADYATANAWWGVPGCVALAGHPCGDPASWLNLPWADDLRLDPWLQRQLVPALRRATREPDASTTVAGRSVAAGPAVRLTLQPPLQNLAQTMADCFVGDGDIAGCSAAAPGHATWLERYLADPKRMRAAALGIVLMDVATGEVVALAGSLSDCSAQHLARQAQPDARGRMQALRPGHDCAQLPDGRMRWLAQQHPALWMLPPGSAVKPLALAAGIDAALVPRSEDARWLRVLAESRERLPVQHLALASGPGYLGVLAGVGFGQPAADLLWGRPEAAGWPTQPMQGTEALRPARMTLAEAERIRAEKAAGVNVDRRYGPEVMHEFVAARRLADAALGGADLRMNAWALADLWRQVALRADGATQAPRPHLARGAAPPGMQSLEWLSPAAAQRTLAASAGVTAAAVRGTAQGSCRWAFSACPPQGWPGVVGKTGTSDFLLREHGAEVKPGLQLPAKLFGGVFTAADGRRYAVGAMALRVRQEGTSTLELSSSAAAEAALLMGRALSAEGGNAPAQHAGRTGL